MIIDLALLRVIKYKESFDKVYRYIPHSGIDKRTKMVADDINKYFEMHTEEVAIDFPAFRSLFFTSWHKKMTTDDIAYFNAVLTRMEANVSEQIKKNIVNQLLELEFATQVANACEEYGQGEEIDIISVVHTLANTVRDAVERTTNHEFADIFDSTIGEEGDDDGLKWPLKIMNEVYRRIQGGDLTIVAARPGKGKTSFLTFLCWAMAQQMEKNKIIVWFNNESRRQRIMSRQIMSALNATNSELATYQADDTLRTRYIEAMGRPDRVRVYDVHGKNTQYLEDVIEAIGLENIGAIICDMLDNVKFPTIRDMREDQRLEQMYQWLREMGVRCNCPTFPTSQISNDGAGLMFPTENMLKDSKTGKQGACDNILMIGSSDDPRLQHSRGISMPKTKTKREGQSDLREEILFDADRGRFKEGIQ